MNNPYYIYVIELDDEVLGIRQFLEENPDYCCEPDRPPLYVGMTGRTPEIRFEQHRAGYKASRYTREHCCRLRPDLYQYLNPLTREEAERLEVIRACELRQQGYAVWQN